MSEQKLTQLPANFGATSRKINRLAEKGESQIAKVAKEQLDYDERRREKLKIVSFIAMQIDESLLPKDTRIYIDYYGITIYIPWSKENLGAARKAIGKNWESNSQHQDDSGALTKTYYQNVDSKDPWGGYHQVSLSIIMDPQKLASGACRRILVSEEVKHYSNSHKVYKVICEDGSETFETDVDTEVGIPANEFAEISS